MPVEITTSWTQRIGGNAGHYRYYRCLRHHKIFDILKKHCQVPLRDRCGGPVEQSLQNKCHIYMERTRLAMRGEAVDDMEGFPSVESYLNCSQQSRDGTEVCLTHLIKECKKRPSKVSKFLRANMSVMETILKDIPRLKVVHLLRDPRAIINSRSKLGWLHELNVSIEARLLCTKMCEDIRQRQKLEKRYPGVTMEFTYEGIAQRPMVAIPALYDFAGIAVTNSTISWLKNFTSQSAHISTQWSGNMSPEIKAQIDKECVNLYKITRYNP